MKPIIWCDDLRKRYGSTTALRGVDLAVPPGVTALVGENGAGKTTLMRILACVTSPTTGDARVLGCSIRRQPAEIRRRVGFVPQHPVFHDWMTVAEVMWFHSAFYDGWDVDYAEQLRRHVALEADRKVYALTTGMRTRLSMVLALSHRPDILLLDEPLAGLDPSVREDVIELLIEHQSESACSILISSHQIEEIDALIERVVYLERGRILFDQPREMLDRSLRRLEIVFDGPLPDHLDIPGLLRSRRSGQRILADVTDYSDELLVRLKRPGIRSIEAFPLNLEESFVAFAKRGRA